MITKIKQHLTNNQITFLDHFNLAIISGVKLIYAGLSSIIHAFVPCFFDSTAAKIVANLYHQRIKHHPNKIYRDFK